MISVKYLLSRVSLSGKYTILVYDDDDDDDDDDDADDDDDDDEDKVMENIILKCSFNDA